MGANQRSSEAILCNSRQIISRKPRPFPRSEIASEFDIN